MNEGDNERFRDAGETGSPAIGLAFDAARDDASVSAEARVFLREQTRLVRLQAEQLIEESSLMRWSLRLKRAGEMMKFAFELSVALVLVIIVIALAGALWSAAHDNGLVIEAFSVPPDLTSRGLSGEVVAGHLLDKLIRMQDETNSIRPADTYRNNWGDDIKVEIPDTGISIGELNRYLRHWLGHETHINGEVYRTPQGLAVTARAGGAGVTFRGKEGDLDALMQKAAESVYAQTQPYRYVAYLGQMNRRAEAMQMLEAFAAVAPPAERAWDYSFLGNLYESFGREKDALSTLRAAVAADPGNAHAWENLSDQEQTLNHLEDALHHSEKAWPLYDQGSVAFNPDRIGIIKLQNRVFVAQLMGDYLTAIRMDEAIRAEPDRGGTQKLALIDEAAQFAAAHDPSRADALDAEIRPVNSNEWINKRISLAGIAFIEERWDTLRRLLDIGELMRNVPAELRPVLGTIYARLPSSWLALADARTGDLVGAMNLIGRTPLDCFTCVLIRGRIDATAKRWHAAAFWFARSERLAPSLPDAPLEWSKMLLEKGDASGAASKAAAASRIAPHYADALEVWGEALMRENRSDLAAEKFSAAAKFAPNWGRLHLEWGEALSYSGTPDEARAQYAIASGLYLEPAERSRLRQLQAH